MRRQKKRLSGVALPVVVFLMFAATLLAYPAPGMAAKVKDPVQSEIDATNKATKQEERTVGGWRDTGLTALES